MKINLKLTSFLFLISFVSFAGHKAQAKYRCTGIYPMAHGKRIVLYKDIKEDFLQFNYQECEIAQARAKKLQKLFNKKIKPLEKKIIKLSTEHKFNIRLIKSTNFRGSIDRSKKKKPILGLGYSHCGTKVAYPPCVFKVKANKYNVYFIVDPLPSSKAVQELTELVLKTNILSSDTT